ncbi:TonB-dependent receptor [Bacteroides fluxus]|mgnify:FL=1|jgi:TonB-linked SusC/RagA family outer membrane protein|uniref:TonB-dependent receptor n=1 Tax=Bacteroides fluxus TaxID=626930 RepID=UPI0023552CB1|nr:TonB-dependent receptor [Bacteroides fluxus]
MNVIQNMFKLKCKDTKFCRINFFILLYFIFLTSVSVHAQTNSVNLNLKNVTLARFLQEIEKQSTYRFSYKDADLAEKEPVTISAKNQSVKSLLTAILSKRNLEYQVTGNKILITVSSVQSKKSNVKRKISGVVVDEKGESIIGANVSEKGTTNGTITDVDGQFSLEVGDNSNLLISYIGYNGQDLPIKGREIFNITLKENSQALDEVVVVGYGTQKKVNLTGAVSAVDSEALENRPVMTASQALQGLVPGLQITQNSGSMDKTASINIRGIATIGEGSDGSPLILIDGMEGDLNAINPQDIENISVLKDAAASSIYGSRAPFGVVLVTTKRGRTGKPTLNYNNSFRWSSPVLLPESPDSYTFALFMNDGNINGGMTPFFTEEHLQRILDYQSGKITESIIPNPSNPSKWGDGYLYGNDNVDWFKAIFRTNVFSQEHNFSINGGTEDFNYYVSANYLDQNGMMQFNQDTYDRFASTVKVNIKVTDWLKFNYSSRFIREDYGRPSDLTNSLYYYLVIRGWPTLPLYDPNGYLYDSPTPALGLRDGGRDRKKTDNLYQQAQLVIEPVKDWRTFVDFNYRIENQARNWDYQKTYNHDVEGNPYPYRNSSHVYEGHNTSNYMNINAYTEYGKQLESGHNFKGMVGFQAELMKYKSISLQREGIIVPSLPSIDITSGTDAYGKEVAPSVTGNLSDWATAGFFGRLNYDYEGRYLAEINLRYDGTSRFRSDKRWKMFPSFSLGWNIAREEFWKPWEDMVGTLKLRASYGELGNQNTKSWYPTYQTMSVNASNGSWLVNGAKPNTAYAPGLVSSLMTWEQIKTWDIGLDFGALGNRLTGSFDYYQRQTLDMVGPAPELPVILGTGVPKMNNTDLKTYGFDLSVAWNDRLKNGLGYGVKFILSDSQTKITRYPNQTGRLDTYREGMKYGEIWGYTTVGIAKTQEEMDAHLASLPNGGQDAIGSRWEAGDLMFADVNGDGKIDNGANTINDHGDLKIIGNSTPRFQFGLDISADYKGFDFRVFFQGVMKRKYFQNSWFFWGSGSGVYGSSCQIPHLDYFRDDENHPLGLNMNSYFPRPDFSDEKNHQVQTGYLQNAAYIRLKNIQLGYTLPESLTRKFAISKLRLFVSGENLWTGASLFENFDPETIDGGSQGNVYPLSKVISCGLSVNF